MKSSDLLVQCLENEGVTRVFGVPGEETLDIVESLRASSIQFTTTRHEQAAAFMAATYGRLTGRAGVVLTTLGPGATNLATGLAYAQLGGFPLVALTGQKPIKQTKQGKFQQVNIIRLTEPITKMSRRVDSAEKIPALVSRAFRHAEGERPGAALLEIPEDIARENTGTAPIPRRRFPLPAPNQTTLRETAELIASSRAPVVIIGADAKRWNIENELAAFIDTTRIPFVATQLGKGMVPETHPSYLGTTSLSEGERVHDVLNAADTLIVIGHTTFEKPPCIPNHARQKIIHINTTPTEISYIYQPSIEVVGDVSLCLRAMTSAVPEMGGGADVLNMLPVTRKTPREMIDEVAAALQTSVPNDAIIALDNGLYKLAITREFRAMWRHHLLLDNTLATMGAGLASAIAAKLVYPERPVIAVCGDGGFIMNSQELETAVRLGLDVLVIVLNDNAFGMIREKQRASGFSDFGVTYGNPDFVKYAESYGARGYRLAPDGDLVDMLSRLLLASGVTLLEVPIAYSK